jgi:hypothetical protein
MYFLQLLENYFLNIFCNAFASVIKYTNLSTLPLRPHHASLFVLWSLSVPQPSHSHPQANASVSLAHANRFIQTRPCIQQKGKNKGDKLTVVALSESLGNLT